jgi:hypothetical protein
LAGSAAKWKRVCLAYTRPWIWSPAPQKNNKINNSAEAQKPWTMGMVQTGGKRLISLYLKIGPPLHNLLEVPAVRAESQWKDYVQGLSLP